MDAPSFTELTPAQKRIWLAHEVAENGLYTVPTRLDIRGPINLDVLRSAVTEVVHRHDALRTRYPLIEGIPRAVVGEEATSSMPEISAAEISEEFAHVFAIDREPPVRFAFAKVDDRHSVLIAIFHHIAVDLISLRILFQELAEVYRNLCGGGAGSQAHATGLETVQHQIEARDVSADDRYIARVRRRAASVAEAHSVAAPFPTDRPRPPLPMFTGAVEHTKVTKELAAKAVSFAAGSKVTLNIVLLAALVSTFAHWTKSPTILVGLPVSGRTARTRSAIGCFVNLVPIVVDASMASSSADLIALVRDTVLDALDDQDLAFDDVVRQLPDSFRSSELPIVSIVFDFHSEKKKPLFLGTSPAELAICYPPGTAKFDLTLGARYDGKTLEFELEFDTELFEPSTAEKLLREYEKGLLNLISE